MAHPRDRARSVCQSGVLAVPEHEVILVPVGENDLVRERVDESLGPSEEASGPPRLEAGSLHCRAQGVAEPVVGRITEAFLSHSIQLERVRELGDPADLGPAGLDQPGCVVGRDRHRPAVDGAVRALLTFPLLDGVPDHLGEPLHVVPPGKGGWSADDARPAQELTRHLERGGVGRAQVGEVLGDDISSPLRVPAVALRQPSRWCRGRAGSSSRPPDHAPALRSPRSTGSGQAPWPRRQRLPVRARRDAPAGRC